MDCVTKGGTPFIAAVDLNILPRIEAAQAGNPGAAGLTLKVRNNTGRSYAGDAVLSLAGSTARVPVSLQAGSEKLVGFSFPDGFSYTTGDNPAELQLPGEEPVTVHLAFSKPEVTPALVPIPIPEGDMMGDTLWNTIRVMPGFPHIFFTFTNYGWPKPMWALKNVALIGVPEIPGLTFGITGKHFVPVSHLSGHVSYKLDLGHRKYKKIYLLVLSFVDNHDMFSAVARVTAYSGNEAVYKRTLHYPGDVDYWVPDRNPTSFASFREPRPDRFELLPMLTAGSGDWKEGKPPAFPQPKWWSISLPVVTESCLMNVIEISPGKPGELDFLEFESLGTMPAFGIVAATGELSEQ